MNTLQKKYEDLGLGDSFQLEGEIMPYRPETVS